MSPNREEQPPSPLYTAPQRTPLGGALAFAHEQEHLHCDAAAREVRLCVEDINSGCEKLRRALAELEA